MTKLFIDCDPGLDDAIAILLAGKAENLQLCGVSTVAGNQTVAKTTENARRIVGLGNLQCPVVQGAARPLLREPIIADDVHGESGLGGAELPPVDAPLAAENAILWLAQQLLNEEEPVTLVSIGPMTNTALLLSTFPDVKKKIQRIVMMGGSVGQGNVTPSAEFNVLADPEAAKIVFQSGVPVNMVGLDVTYQVLATPSIVEKIRKLNNSVSEYVSTWLTDYINAYYKTHGIEGGALHDPLAVAVLMDSDVVQFEEMYVDVETRGDLTYGRTVCARKGQTGKAPNAQVAVGVKPDLFWDMLFAVLMRY
ncbi:nucleoside hydrolase [Alicyclobacillus pomorum]|jgi:inosine-uridine nucleoside N-ribohydrolase|uniref:nucleoside hydrolase n=1 Tax=Alicyclobacillus pomorum TaxID=204470 RepID=UPI00047CF8E4|nr:nucleoside hydrolase [Alicyclobacillus pomorum]